MEVQNIPTAYSPYIVYNNNYECHVNSDGDGNAARVYYYSYGRIIISLSEHRLHQRCVLRDVGW